MRCALVTSLCFASLLAACAPEGTSAYVSKNLIVGQDCKVNVDDDEGWAVGAYDIAGSTSMRSPTCQNSYYTHLVVNSRLKTNANPATGRAEPNVLQITEAEISLIDIEQQGLIPFETKSGELPNPFRVKSNITLEPTSSNEAAMGAVAIETIPVGYASGLTDYINQQILAEVTIFGTTLGDVDVDFRPFTFPIYICQECMTICKSIIPEGATQDEIYGDECPDNAGQDGRVCVNPDC